MFGGALRPEPVGGRVTGASEHVQPSPVISTGVSPGGSVSATTTSPAVGPAVAALATVSVYASAVSPWAKLPECVLVTVSAGGFAAGATVAGLAAGRIVVAALTDAGALASPPPPTLTVSLPLAAAFPATLATTVIGGVSPFSPASGSPR